MSRYQELVVFRQRILSELKKQKTLEQLQADGIIMSSDFWLSQEQIEDEFESETWHYLLLVELSQVVDYLGLKLTKEEMDLKQYL